MSGLVLCGTASRDDWRDLYNRQLHPDEAKKLSELEKGKSADEKQKLEDAACYMVHCADQMSDGNPAKAAALASQERGASDATQQGELASTGLFKYDNVIDGGFDLASRGWDWTGPGLVRGATNFFNGGAADSANQFVGLMKGGAQNDISQSATSLVIRSIQNGVTAIGGIEGGGPTASPGLQLADSTAGQAVSPSPSLGAPGYVPSNATLNSGNDGNDARQSNPSKADSPVWQDLNNAGNGVKTDGKRYYEWDYTHNDIEVYNKRGQHLGSMDPVTGEMYKPAVPGRKLNNR